MSHANHPYAPFFRNGRLHLPAETINHLLEQGLSAEIGAQLMQGIWLDNGPVLSAVQQAVIRLLEHTPVDHPLYQALTSDEAQFMLDLKDASTQ
jgi:hypothetical protein